MNQEIEVQDIPIQDRPEAVIHITDDTVFIDKQEYRIKTNHKQALTKESLLDRYTQLLQKYDYIVGDWAHEKLRLRGFYKDTNTSVSDEYKISFLDDYLHEYCAFGCAYFVLELNGEPIPYKDEKSTKESYRRHRRPYYDKKRSHQPSNKQDKPYTSKKTSDKIDNKIKKDSKSVQNTQSNQQRPKRHHFTIIKTKGE